MTRALAFLLSLTVLAMPAFARDKPRMYLDYDADDDLVLMVNGHKVEPSWGNRYDPSEFIKDDPKAVELFEEHVAADRRAWYALFGGLAWIVVLPATPAAERWYGGTFLSVWFGGYLAAMIYGIHESNASGRALVRGMNQYNGVYDSPSASAGWHVGPAGLAYSF